MAFILDGLETETYDRTYSDKQLFKRIVSYMKPFARKLIGISIILFFNSLAASFGPILISKALDILIQGITLPAVVMLTGGILLLGVAAWIFNYILQRLDTVVIGNLVLKLQEDAFAATLDHDLSFFDEHPTGKIVSRITTDTQDFSYIITLLTELGNEILLFIILFTWLVIISPLLTLVLIIFAPFAVVIALSFRQLARRVTKYAKRFTAKINTHIQESISGIMVAKTFRQEARIYQDFLENNTQGYRVGLRRGLVLTMIFPLMGIVSGLGIAILVYVSSFPLKANGLSPGGWYLFMQAVGYFFYPLLSMASFYSQFQDGLSAAERVFSLIDSRPRVIQRDAKKITACCGAIEFKNLSFRYKENEPVFDNFSLSIQKNESVALVGHTGAGKSSIASLIGRFYEFQKGQLFIDGYDIRELDLADYRRHIGVVPQDPFLFSGTVRENIKYGRPEATDKEIREAAYHIGNGEWVDDLSKGLDTKVSPRGSNLSMGQRQLVALARMLLRDPRLFIMDEATSSVDPFTEVLIQEGLKTIMQDRTVIIIAHRLSTVRHVHRIIVLDHGKIIEEGNHQTLLKKDGYYAELYNTYFRHQSLEYVESYGKIN
jgi:ATP-binding cassette subfamily B protein